MTLCSLDLDAKRGGLSSIARPGASQEENPLQAQLMWADD